MEIRYKEYIDKVNNCFGVDANPKLREDIIYWLDDIVRKYQDLEYKKEHYKTFYEKVLNKIEVCGKSGDLLGLTDCNLDFFDYDYQDKLADLSDYQDLLLDIGKNSSYDKIKKTAIELYNIVANEKDLSESFVEIQKEKISTFNDCLLEIDEELFTCQVPYEVKYFTAYTNKVIANTIDFACLWDLDRVKSLIKDFKNSPYNSDLRELSISLQRLETIKESSDEYSINDEIENLLKEISEDAYLYSSSIGEYNQKAKALIHEYRYG